MTVPRHATGDRGQHRPETAGRHLVRAAPLAHVDDTCAEVLEALRSRHFDYVDAIVILDAQERVVGAVPAGRLATLAPATRMHDVMLRNIPHVTTDVDQERVASLAIRSPLAMAVVVDAGGRFIGVVPPQTLLRVLRHEHVEDLHRLTGVMRETEMAREAMEEPPARRVAHRLPWLLVGLAGSILAALVMASYEAMLQTRVAIAFFVPGIVYLADAIGTQTEAIAVRGLSLSHLGIRRLLTGELWTGLLIGAVLGGVTFIVVWLAMGDMQLALAVGVALIAAGAIATVIGLLLPWAFHRFGMDPAYGSGPLATVIQDVLSLLVYFACVTQLLDIAL